MTLELASLEALVEYEAADPALLLTAAEALVRSYCGWHIAPPRTDDLVLDGPGGYIVALPSLHVTDVADVIDGETVLTADDYEWSQSGFLYSTALWTSTLRGISLSMTHGYTAVPAEVQAVVLSVAARAVGSAGAGGLRAMTVGGVQKQWAADSNGLPLGVDLSTLERSVLDRYRLADVA